VLLTLQAVGVQQILALLVTLDTALHTSHSLPSDAPEEALALVAVGRRRGGPGDEVVRGGGRYGVDHRLQGLLVHVHLLRACHRDCDPLNRAYWQAGGRGRETRRFRKRTLFRFGSPRVKNADALLDFGARAREGEREQIDASRVEHG